MNTILIKGVWLIREGLDPGYAVVVVVLPDGTLRKVITERLDGSFSQYIDAAWIRDAETFIA